MPGSPARPSKRATPKLLPGKEVRVSPGGVGGGHTARKQLEVARRGRLGESDPHRRALLREVKEVSISAGPFGTDITRNTLKTPAFTKLSLQKSIIFIVACP